LHVFLSELLIVTAALLDFNSTVPIAISALSCNVAAVVPFAFTVTPSTLPITSPAAKAFVFPFATLSPFNK